MAISKPVDGHEQFQTRRLTWEFKTIASSSAWVRCTVKALRVLQVLGVWERSGAGSMLLFRKL